MIPVLIAPAYNRHDLLHRMLKSIDVSVGKTLILDNGHNYEGVPVGLSHLSPTVFRPPYESIGYGGAINLGITQNPDAPWWFWASNDIEFHPGHLFTVIERMNATKEPRIVTGGFTWGAVNVAAIDLIGLVDDWSFFPIYFDDNDYQYRAKLAGVEWIEDWGGGSKHGDGEHLASLTIHSSERVKRANDNSFTLNAQAYRAKWGGFPGEERYTSPWDTGWPVWVTKPNITGRRDRRW